MPPGHRPHHGHRHRHSLGALAAAADRRRLADALSPIVADARDREFVVRCILDEGPLHHRAASWALLMLASEVARRLEGAPVTAPDDPRDSLEVRLKLPPHLAEDATDAVFPVRLPLAPLRAVADGERDVEALADALADGPPHHALANAVLVSLFARILAKLPTDRAER